MTFGIPLSVMSVVRNDGSMDLTKHLAWLARMEEEEESKSSTRRPLSGTTGLADTTSTSTAAVLETTNLLAAPGEMDVIMGKGLRGKSSKGNQLLRRLVEERQDEYNSAVRIKKQIIAGEIYNDMQRKGCRFLEPLKSETNGSPTKRSTGTLVWEKVPEAEAVNRICHIFRNLRQSAA